MRRVLCSLAIFLLLFSCTSNLSPQTSNFEPLKIGLIAPLTGPAAEIGNIYLEGAQLAVDDLNKKHILDKQIELVVEDTASDPKRAVSAMQKMISVDNIKFFATITSSHALALKPVAEKNSVLLFADAAHPQITDNADFVLRHSNVAPDEARILADKIIELSAKKVSILSGDDDYGRVFNDELTRNLKASSVEVKSELYDLTAVDLRSEITKLTNDVDVFVIGGFGPAVPLAIRQTRELNFKGDLVVGIAFPIMKLYTLGALVDGVYSVDYPYSHFTSYDGFAEKFKAKFNKEPVQFHPVSYGSIELMVNVIAQSNSENPAVVVDKIKAMGSFDGKYEQMSITEQGDVIIPLIVSQFETE
ncbi:hypothetical protein COV18_04060 [Candidatus Woesearchaeota archaeon CG10_big_fil_rev_8_21_14_0_10_37_12]|nr:MAG: hypothetical protein COV18_04060 [Candidatus Woesearchaeota archaeon CG10_big_fil_rev_8_21_14_0_10_37_12]